MNERASGVQSLTAQETEILLRGYQDEATEVTWTKLEVAHVGGKRHITTFIGVPDTPEARAHLDAVAEGGEGDWEGQDIVIKHCPDGWDTEGVWVVLDLEQPKPTRYNIKWVLNLKRDRLLLEAIAGSDAVAWTVDAEDVAKGRAVVIEGFPLDHVRLILAAADHLETSAIEQKEGPA